MPARITATSTSAASSSAASSSSPPPGLSPADKEVLELLEAAARADANPLHNANLLHNASLSAEQQAELAMAAKAAALAKDAYEDELRVMLALHAEAKASAASNLEASRKRSREEAIVVADNPVDQTDYKAMMLEAMKEFGVQSARLKASLANMKATRDYNWQLTSRMLGVTGMVSSVLQGSRVSPFCMSSLLFACGLFLCLPLAPPPPPPLLLSILFVFSLSLR